MRCVLDWLIKYEAVAVWIEGIALVAILVADLVTAHNDRKETQAQLKLAQEQIKISQNAERAWLMTELTWTNDNLHVVTETSGGNPGDGSLDTTTVAVYLRCKNEGRSPAFIEKIQGYSELVEGRLADLPSPVGHKAEPFPTIGPIAPGKEEKLEIHLRCEGHVKSTQKISLFVLVEYRDIFAPKRVTTCGYTVVGTYLSRQDQFPDRNHHT